MSATERNRNEQAQYRRCECHRFHEGHAFAEDLICDWCGVGWHTHQGFGSSCPRHGKKRRLRRGRPGG